MTIGLGGEGGEGRGEGGEGGEGGRVVEVNSLKAYTLQQIN